jgi:hypothetical protein
VTASRRTTAFHHFTVGGDLTIEEEELLEERVEAVSCRWCGTESSVSVLEGAEGPHTSPSAEAERAV